MKNEPHGPSVYGQVPPNEQTWELVLTARARRVYTFGGEIPSGRVLPNTLGLEPVYREAYRYDSQGVPTEPHDFLRIATQLAEDEGWLTHGWGPECADVFMRKADAIIWLDDARARLARQLAQAQRQDHDLLWMTVRRVRRAVQQRRSRRSGAADDAGHLLDFAIVTQPADPYGAFVTMVLSEFPEKVLRITNNEQIAALNAVRPTR
jgi:hypothetical protein